MEPTPNKVFFIEAITERFYKIQHFIVVTAKGHKELEKHLYDHHRINRYKSTDIEARHKNLYDQTGEKKLPLQAKTLYYTNIKL